MKNLRGLAGLAVLFACAPLAQAQLTIYMSDSFGHVLTVTDGGAGDISSVANSIVIDPSLLVSTFSQLDPTTLVSGTDNFGTSDPYRYVSENVLLKAFNPTGGQSAGDIFIQISDTGFTVPSTDPKMLSAAFSGSFTNASPATGAEFTGEADFNNVLFGQTVLTNTASFSSTGSLPNAFSANLGYPIFSGAPYSMTAYSNFQLDSGAVVQATGIVAATPAPEPVSIAFLACGVVALLRRRR